ncbi:sensor histidine kinase [Bacillus chungangensis]|uniref:Heme sensor protein HssS n=1 Tax=Bacillus chungangensis TaxID=587633 RepID=A0ABT9WRK7_9BACI|nr:HAMP domain-containing sensor histidine kinase [Bacillus chungangensis]MDQ0175930.1 signal transduction histidine kinase [Bacillus chungangensis]
MKKRAMYNLRFALVLLVFFIMLISSFVIAFLFYILIKLNIITLGVPNIFLHIALILLTSIILVTTLTAISGKRVLHPIRELNKATKEVAKGNFKIQVEIDRHNELSDLTRSFNKMVQELGSIETMRNDFVTNISHEFKTPITSMQGYAMLLQDEELSADERREYTDMIIAGTRQLSKLSSNILKLSKFENQKIITDNVEFSLDEQIRRSLLMIEPQWSEKNIELDIDLEPVRYCGSVDLLQHVWLNLLDNAIKFSNEGGKISVRLSEAGDHIITEIADNGIGMNEETKKHLFDKFYQGDKSRSSEGSGLGLPLVKRIVELSGGAIHVKSELGIGSVFTVELPKNREVGNDT